MSAEMMPGYKQTEVGVIPEDWEVKALGAIGSVIRGASPRPKGDKRFYGGDVPRLMVEDVTRDKKFVTPTIDFLTTAGAKLSRPCKRGTLTVVCSGTPAVVGLPSFLAVDACIHDGMLGFTNLSPKVVPDFLFHRLTSYQERLYAAATHGGTFVNLTTKGFGAFKVALPPTEAEQRGIAEALSDVDALIAKLDAFIAKKRDLKQAAMQQLLTGQTRLPGFNGAWKVVKAADIGRFAGGSGFPTKFQGAPAGEYPFFKVSDMNNTGNDTFMETANNYISEALRKQLGAAAFPAESIVFAKVGAAVFLERKKILRRASCLDNNMAAFVLDASRANCRFIHYQLLNTNLGNLVSTTALPSLSGSVLSAIELPLPPVPEQTAIATVLSDMDAEIAALEARREKTLALKKGMMQEVLTGRIRLA